jgi:archaemetzincin
MKITLRPLGNIDEDVVEALKKGVSNIFCCSVAVEPGSCDLSLAYNAKRKQYSSTTLLASLPCAADEKVVGITDVDLYVPRLNFVFGEADVTSGKAIVSLYRLRQEYYGLSPDKGLFLQRAIKELVHELGHLFGLGHCSNSKCVMHFSNSLADTDFKEARFCYRCCPKLFL